MKVVEGAIGEATARFVGTVVGEGVVLRNATLEVDGKEERSSSIPCSFAVELQDGRTIEVRASEETSVGPKQTRKGNWEALREDPIAILFRDRAPGGHVEVALEGVVIAAGDKVVIDGVVDERRPESDGYRGVHQVATAITADLIGVGDHSKIWVDSKRAQLQREQKKGRAVTAKAAEARTEIQGARERMRAEGRELSIVASVLVSLGGLAAFGAGSFLAWSGAAGFLHRALLALGLMFTGLGLYAWRRRRFTPRMSNAAWQSGGVLWSIRPWASYLMGYGVPAAAMVILVGATDFEGWRVVTYLVPVFVLVVLWVVLILETREHARGVRILSSSASTDGDGWGAREGQLVEGELERRLSHSPTTSTHATTSHVETTTGTTIAVRSTTTSSAYKSSGSGGKGSLKVRIGERTIDVIVEPPALWGTTRRYIEGLTLTERIAPGDALLVVGRIDDNRMQATGPESLLLFASHRGPARASLVRALLGHRIGMLGFAALVVAAIALTVQEIVAL